MLPFDDDNHYHDNDNNYITIKIIFLAPYVSYVYYVGNMQGVIISTIRHPDRYSDRIYIYKVGI